MTLRRIVGTLMLMVLAAVALGCSDVGYNPYVQNGGNRPIGKTLESVPDGGIDAVSHLDNLFENAYN